MPHLVVEYSANLDGRIEMSELLRVAHAAAASVGPFPLGGIRTRLVRRDTYMIADGHADNGFVHLTLTIGAGRDLATKRAAGDVIFAAVADFLQPAMQSSPVALSFYLFETDPNLSWKRSTVHDAVARRATDRGDAK
ncbi:MAG TPA: 5-carboxymethyl-2-hydroxymuconate Delta-isomerase [Acidimicrobiia bacterium]|jgi:5-carboxymethyl-2-hydroxymuconate isomerase|nr:5-carboxymethyl-2-hydroxymuconate Delta-isomerase [Acidimicrobiia bacterium]